MAGYVNENFNVFIPDKDINEITLHENPAPDNIQNSQILVDYLIEILREKHKHLTVAFDNVFKTLQKCNSLAVGPLSSLWVGLEEETESKITCVNIVNDLSC